MIVAWKARAQAMDLAQTILWPQRGIYLEVARDLAGIGAKEYEWRGTVRSGNGQVLCSMRASSEKKASLGLLLWVCDAVAAKAEKEIVA